MSRLWNVEDQTARLAELTSRDRDLKEAPLRRDVRSLGRLSRLGSRQRWPFSLTDAPSATRNPGWESSKPTN